MRYPLWAFLFVFMLPPFAAHALLSGNATLNGVRVNHSPVIAQFLR